uniref:Uncharacterized protein n=1 Tax=Rhizophora mucronata TaxID=61149 RepID=A0A2P2QQB4_RHIMU
MLKSTPKYLLAIWLVKYGRQWPYIQVIFACEPANNSASMKTS